MELFVCVQGRIDDNIETIRKRFKVFVEQSVPVVNYYDLRGKVKKVRAETRLLVKLNGSAILT